MRPAVRMSCIVPHASDPILLGTLGVLGAIGTLGTLGTFSARHWAHRGSGRALSIMHGISWGGGTYIDMLQP